jgi:alpha-beta hydrolase superfamily lysophospholipase
MIVDLITVKAADGLTLDGILRTPANGANSSLPVDIVIMHHGVGGNFYRDSFQDLVALKFLERGCAVLRVNNRGHDLAYNAPPPHRRVGAAFENVDESRLDWKAWIDFAASRGYKSICVWGHSLGAVKNIYVLAKEGDARITRAISSSPPRFSYSAYQSHRDGKLFDTSVTEAQALVDAKKSDAVMAIEIPTSAIMTPKTFFDKYGPEERYDILNLLPQIKKAGKPALLVTIGSLEGQPKNPDRFAFEGLADKVTALAGGNLAFQLIDGADHSYTGVTDKLWNAIEAWLGAK